MDVKGTIYYERKHVPKTNIPVISDCKFLIDFIMNNYLGPDVKSDIPRRSVSQRLITGMPPYRFTDLGPSYVSISLLERLYYYLLRYALPGLVLDINMFHMYLKGKLLFPSSDFTENSKQFTSFYPLDLHPQRWFPESFRIIKGIVLIDDPISSGIKEKDLNRFMSLTGVNTLKLNQNECLGVKIDTQVGKDVGDSNGANEAPEKQSTQEYKRKYIDDTPPTPEFPRVVPTKQYATGDHSKKICSRWDGPSLMPLLSIPDVDDCDQGSSFVLTGTAKSGKCGPPVGVVDIGTSKAAYLFRVSLPGVRKDYSQFSCEIEYDGRVHIKGLLGGGRTITKQSRVYDMKVRQLCSPGPFTLSFRLPGPVDPRLFAPNFKSDGIFEAVVIKH
ncbi:hypothetical protein HN51_058091 [Arachis hypogaea]|uniref:SHSP domain-containing protein n=1 Tax=Arachis hypogaea TaxID=3818 RepID=A0A444WZC0_ARAHY|nr:increased DNA methylation 3 [Arachis hypogaea]QHN81256.1 Increased DNA methylation [Arachis hypogaea]QHN81257.1 Increased DNA methylation [Arachis hypogaea]RYQ82804.1 hypothetical protein Ahy_B10g101374 [Arachis hypogaea]